MSSLNIWKRIWQEDADIYVNLLLEIYVMSKSFAVFLCYCNEAHFKVQGKGIARSSS
jgi:hypothetical protein